MFGFIEEISERVEGLEKESRKIERIEGELKLQNRHFDFLLIIVSVILVACFLTFVMVSLDYFKFTKEERQNFYNRLEQIDKENRNKQIEYLKEQLKEIKSSTKDSDTLGKEKN